MPSDRVSLGNTCEHGFTEKYRLYKENLLKRKLKMIDNDNDYDQKDHHDQDNHQKNRHHKKKINNNHLQCVEMIKISNLNDL